MENLRHSEIFPALRPGPWQMLPCVWHLLTLANLLWLLLGLLLSPPLLIAFCSKLGLRRVSWRPCDWQAPLPLTGPLPHLQSNGLQQAEPSLWNQPLPLLSGMSFVWKVYQYRLHTLSHITRHQTLCIKVPILNVQFLIPDSTFAASHGQ